MTTTRPRCPYPCAGSFCPYTGSEPECLACEARPLLDAYRRDVAAWEAEQDRTGASHPYTSPALSGWGGGDR